MPKNEDFYGRVGGWLVILTGLGIFITQYMKKNTDISSVLLENIQLIFAFVAMANGLFFVFLSVRKNK